MLHIEIFLKKYFSIHITIGTDVEFTYSHFKYKTTQKYFDSHFRV